VYRLNETVVTVEGIPVLTYGITADKCSVTAISTDRGFVEKLICDFNNGGLDSLQMKEVIEDILGDKRSYTKKL